MNIRALEIFKRILQYSKLQPEFKISEISKWNNFKIACKYYSVFRFIRQATVPLTSGQATFRTFWVRHSVASVLCTCTSSRILFDCFVSIWPTSNRESVGAIFADRTSGFNFGVHQLLLSVNDVTNAPADLNSIGNLFVKVPSGQSVSNATIFCNSCTTTLVTHLKRHAEVFTHYEKERCARKSIKSTSIAKPDMQQPSVADCQAKSETYSTKSKAKKKGYCRIHSARDAFL